MQKRVTAAKEWKKRYSLKNDKRVGRKRYSYISFEPLAGEHGYQRLSWGTFIVHAVGPIVGIWLRITGFGDKYHVTGCILLFRVKRHGNETAKSAMTWTVRMKRMIK
jgi:hypothetical protein